MDPKAAPALQLTVSVRDHGSALVLRPEGELDHDSVGPLRDALEERLADPPQRIVVDCSGLSFCDSTGLNLLLRARLRAEPAGGRLMLAAPTPIVARMLEITGADEVVEVFATLDEALTGEPG
ncbi:MULTISPECIES: STAS domain-containing protein [Kitasatospora]|uniref:Anti-sigma factor antagonist n=2 Tax=Kitasatospora TaxID=2063 RepID=A0ABT1J4Q9_9ACTN|nr:STAS domain-containing protein [Kitasatospora paracochleata]MCP2312046.1 anti-anti-sigma factor [Kitasatospora paracochleata]